MGSESFPRYLLVLQFLHSHSETDKTVSVKSLLAFKGTIIVPRYHYRATVQQLLRGCLER